MGSVRGPRGSYSKGVRTRQAVLDAAMRHFARFGYRNAPLASIAEDVGVTRSGLLHHFRSKAELLTAALDERDRQARRAIDRLAAEAHEPLAPFRFLTDEDFRNRGLVQLFTALVGEAVSDTHPAHPQLRERYAATRRIWEVQLTRARDSGALPASLDVPAAAALLVAVMDGLQIQWLYDEAVDMTGLIETFLALLPHLVRE